MEKLQKSNSEFENFVKEGKIKILENGSGSPCINLLSVPRDLCKILADSKCDLIVLEGMGRAIHTNFKTTFSIDCIKLAILKNQWIATKLNGKLFDAVCKFDLAS